jgi:hypothetical protein
MTRHYFKENQEIKTHDLNNFLKAFANRTALTSLPLCELAKEWMRFANNDNNKVLLKQGERLPKGNPPAKPGIYAIFSRKSKAQESVCFHVGISSSNIRGRLRTRLYDNVEGDHRGVFGWLEDCAGIYICPATITTVENSKEAKKRLKAKLELLEMCLTVLLRPKSLLRAAGLR